MFILHSDDYLIAFKVHVSVTFHLRRSPFQENVVCVTCRWIDGRWNMQKRIIDLEVIESDKNGYLIKIFDDCFYKFCYSKQNTFSWC